MLKSTENRKIVTQTQRNYFFNQFYKKKIKLLQKKLCIIFIYLSKHNLTQKIKILVKNLLNMLFSILDKGIKKKVIHKNYGNNKKKIFSKKYFFANIKI
jgi:ribosomal protein S20